MKRNSNKKKEEEEPLPFDLIKEDNPYLPRNTTSLDKIRAYYLEKKKLSPKLEYLRQVYEFANSIMLEGYSKQQTVRFLQGKIPGISQGHCYELVRNTVELFGDITRNSKDAEKYLIKENQWNTYRRAVKAGDIQQENAAMKNLILLGCFHKSSLDYTKLILPIPVFTSDPEVLKQQQTLDIPHEEQDDEEGIS